MSAAKSVQMAPAFDAAGHRDEAPSHATGAVLKPSDPVPDGAQEVKGIEFDGLEGRDITVNELVSNMATMGFQASAVSDAVRIINDMVGNTAVALLDNDSQVDWTLEGMEGPGDSRQNYDISRLYIKLDFFRSSRNNTLPCTAQPRLRHCHYGWWY